jgi:hypothetical protein
MGSQTILVVGGAGAQGEPIVEGAEPANPHNDQVKLTQRSPNQN